MLAAQLIPLFLDETVQPFDRRPFGRVRPDMHDLGRPSFGELLEPDLREPGELGFFLDRRDRLADVFLRHDVRQGDEERPLPVFTLVPEEVGGIVGAPQPLEGHYRVIDGLVLLE